MDDSSNINSSRLSLTQAMDVFALGWVERLSTCLIHVSSLYLPPHPPPHSPPSSIRCVIGELFTDGRQLFDLSQLLELRARQSEYTPETLLKKISDKPVRVSGIIPLCYSDTCIYYCLYCLLSLGIRA